MSGSNENGCHSGYAESIDITRVFRNMSNAKLFAVDIGELPKTILKKLFVTTVFY